MQDLATAVKALNDSTAALKAGGWIAVVALISFLAFLLLKPALARQRKATNEMHVSVAGDKGGGPQGTRVCGLHSGVQATLDKLEEYHEDDKRAQAKLFDKMDAVSKSVSDASVAASAAAATASNAALAAANAANNAYNHSKR